MKNGAFLIICLLILFQNCATWKNNQLARGDFNVAIKNAILDFGNTTFLAERDKAFSVYYKNINDKIIGINIYGVSDKFIITADGKSKIEEMFPTRYLEYKGKLFFWRDNNLPLSKEIIHKLDEYNLIDSVESIAYATLRIDDAKKGMDYFFCKNNLLKYRKKKTNRILGSYQLPKFHCRNRATLKTK